MNCFAVVAPGLESLALAEARALGLPAQPEPGGGGIAWEGDLRSVVLANMGLRIATRVVVRLASFHARSFAELERHARRVPWSSVVSRGDAVSFRVTSKKSRLYHSDAIAQRMGDAVQRAFPDVRVEGADDDEDDEDDAGGAQRFVVRMFRDECTVSADSSGELLHRRGWRLATAKAPLRETMAAAVIAASGWDATSPLVDPFCGSGTIPIEAALLARRIAPGVSRRFAVERWPGVGSALLTELRATFASRQLERSSAIIAGSDRDAGAIAAARANAQRAGVLDDAALVVRGLSALELPAKGPGWIVSNPPYGVRVGEEARVRDLWAHLGNVLRARAPGWRLALLSPGPALERQLGIPVRVVATTSNGGIPVRIVVGEISA